jgi:DNA-binding response OmpR family regulator
VVEDDVDLASIVASTLRREGHDVDTALDGASALRQAHRSPPDSVLLDLGLPDTDGYEVARSLRGGIVPKEVSIIVITGSKWTLDRADQAGVDFVLVKPVASEHLGGLVEYVTRRRCDALRRA